MIGTMLKTTGGLYKKDLLYNKYNKIVSKKISSKYKKMVGGYNEEYIKTFIITHYITREYLSIFLNHGNTDKNNQQIEIIHSLSSDQLITKYIAWFNRAFSAYMEHVPSNITSGSARIKYIITNILIPDFERSLNNRHVGDNSE
jgi:hypothetical protein